MTRFLEWLFPSSIEQAKKIQEQMVEKISLKEDIPPLEWIGGVDVSQNMYDPSKKIYASVVRLTFPDLEVVEKSSVVEVQTFPYVPGFLGFREAPALVKAFNQLTIKPQLLVVDGQGISHPKKLGIATHLGILLDIPTIGVAKSILVGKPLGDLSEEAGSSVPLIFKGEVIGIVFRSKKGSNPLIISAGHKISLEKSIGIVKKCLKGYKLPEPTRQAHLSANEFRKNYLLGMV